MDSTVVGSPASRRRSTSDSPTGRRASAATSTTTRSTIRMTTIRPDTRRAMMRSQGPTTTLYPWDESVRVPFLLRYPKRFGAKARPVSAPLNSSDILPTLLGLCGLPVPDGVEGTDLSRVAEGKERPDGRGALL